MRFLRVAVGLLLGACGALLYAASWQRWAGACSFNQTGGRRCDARQNDYANVYPVFDPWEPVGNAAQLAGYSMLVLAVAFVLLPWALTGRRPGPITGVLLCVVVLVQAAVGVSNLRSGFAGSSVDPLFGETTIWVWFYVPFGVLVRFAFGARGWTLAAAIGLILANPLVSLFSYYNGSFDARPWYEAISGTFTMAAGLCLFAAAALNGRAQTSTSAATTGAPDTAPATSSPS